MYAHTCKLVFAILAAVRCQTAPTHTQNPHRQSCCIIIIMNQEQQLILWPPWFITGHLPAHPIYIFSYRAKKKKQKLCYIFITFLFFGSFCVHLNRIKLRLLFLHRPSYKLVLLGALAFFVWPTSLFCRLLSGRGFVHFCLLFRLNFCLCLSMESHGEMRGIS